MHECRVSNSSCARCARAPRSRDARATGQLRCGGLLLQGSWSSLVAEHGVSLKVRTGRDSPNRRFAVLAGLFAAAAAACAAAVAVTLSGNQSSNPALDAEIRAAIIAVPIGVGLYVWYRDPWRRFGKLLVAAGFAWSLTTLAQSSNEVLYSAGRVFGWLVEPLLIYLVLAFPSGRLTTPAGAAPGRRERAARRAPLPADDAARRLLPDPVAVDQLRRGLPGQRLHAARLGAGLRGRRDPALPRDRDR